MRRGVCRSGSVKYIWEIPDEHYQIRHGFKWSSLKVYRRLMPKGVKGKLWNLQLSMFERHNYKFTKPEPQQVALIVTMRDPNKMAPVYDQTVTRMREIGWITQDCKGRSKIAAGGGLKSRHPRHTYTTTPTVSITFYSLFQYTNKLLFIHLK